MPSNLHPIFVALGATPAEALGSVGGQSSTGDTTILGTLASSGAHTALTVTGVANTGVTASTEAPDVLVNMARTVTWATGALADQRAVKFMAPTYAAVAASTFTRATTVYISAAPTAGANVTLTNAYALWVDAGISRLDGAVVLGSTLTLGGDIVCGSSDITGGGIGNFQVVRGAVDNLSLRPAATGGNILLTKADGLTKNIETNATGIGFNGLAPVAQSAAIADLGAFTDPPSALEMAALRTAVNTLLAYLRLRGDIAAV